MKKFLLLTLLCLSCVASYAAQLTATLQSGDKLTPFYGDNSFVEAYEAAVDGDIITLSPGQFNVVDTIAKSIKIIGSYAFDERASVATIFLSSPIIKASNVFIEGARFTVSVRIKATDQLTFSRCYINLLGDLKGDSLAYHTNTRLVDCQVKTFDAMSYADNIVLQNCCIDHFSDINSNSKLAYIEKCQILFWFKYGETYCKPYAIYKNCLLGIFSFYNKQDVSLNVSSPSELHDTIILSMPFSQSYSITVKTDNCSVTNLVRRTIYSNWPALSFTPYTYNSISYGPIDHKAYPAIPVVTSSEIDSKTDTEGNLHVKINAIVRD